MTPRQAGIHVHFLKRDKAVDLVRMVTGISLAFGGKQEALDKWLATLNLPPET
jgi:hypothetical protein